MYLTMIGLKKMKNKVLDIENYLDELIPNPKCELNYNKDYELLIAVVLSAQSTDKRVNQTTPILFKKYKNLKELKNADLKDLENIIRPVGTYKKKSVFIKEIARIIDEEYNGVFPQDRKSLEKMPGVGRKTVNVVLNELYDYPAIAVDTHVERVSKRLKLAYSKDTVEDVERKLRTKFEKKNWGKRHKQLVLFGRYHCKAIKPECDKCKLQEFCRYYKENNK